MYHLELRPFPRTQWNTALEWDKEVQKIFNVFSKGEAFAPPCEILDQEKFYSIGLDVPGLSKEDLDIEIKDNELHISGERKPSAKTDSTNVIRSERRYGNFSRVFTLPQNVNADLIEARFENGVLEISLPKEEKLKPKKIQISDWKKEDVLPEMKS